MGTYTLSEARANLSSLLDAVAQGEEVTITRHGQEAALLVPPRAHPARTAQMWAAVHQLKRELDEARGHRVGGVVPYDPADHLRTIRADRDAR